MVPAGSQQLYAQDPTPAHRCRTEGRTGHEGREGGNGDGNRDVGGKGRENGDEYIYQGRGKIKSGSENASRRATRTSISNQPQDPPQRVCRIMQKTRAQGRGGGTGSGKAEERRRSARHSARLVEVMRETRRLGRKEKKNVDKIGFGQKLLTLMF